MYNELILIRRVSNNIGILNFATLQFSILLNMFMLLYDIHLFVMCTPKYLDINKALEFDIILRHFED